MKKNIFLMILLFLAAVAVWTGCNNEREDPAPDVSDISVRIKIQRFDKAFASMDTTHFEENFRQLQQKYPLFTEIYFKAMLGLVPGDSVLSRQAAPVKMVLRDTFFRHNFDTAMVVYDDREVEKVEEELSRMFRYYRFYFPDAPVPDVLAFTSFSLYGAVVLSDSLMGIGWDCFLTPHYQHYNPETFPQYIQRTMDRNHLVSLFTTNLLEDKLGGPSQERLLDFMIHFGKELYILDHLLPGAPDSILLGHTGLQTDWLQQNEASLWSHLLTEKLLYETDQKKIRKLVFPSPSAPAPIPDAAPGKSACYIGWQIVKAYMARHPETTFTELIALDDPQKILDASKYKPRR